MSDPSTVVSLWASITSWLTPTTLFLFLNLVIGTIAVTSRFTSHRKPHPQHNQIGPYGSTQLVRASSLLDRVKSINFSIYKFPQHNPEDETHYFPPSEPVYDSHPLDPNPTQLERAPSLLDRVKSINFSIYRFPHHNPEDETRHFPPSEPVYDNHPVDPNPPRLERAPSLLERVWSGNFNSVFKSQQPYPETETEVIDTSVTEPELGLDPGNHPKRSKSETKKTARKVKESVKKSASEKSMVVAEAVEGTETVERRRPETARPERTASFGDGDEGVDAKADDFINKFRKQLKLQRLDSLLRYKEMLKGK